MGTILKNWKECNVSQSTIEPHRVILVTTRTFHPIQYKVNFIIAKDPRKCEDDTKRVSLDLPNSLHKPLYISIVFQSDYLSPPGF